jgi:hypothetical protein
MSLTKVSFSMISNAPINVFDYMTDALRTAITTNSYSGTQKTDVYNAILAAEAATPDGSSMFWPVGTYDIGSNVWTPALKKLKHVGAGSANQGGTVILTGVGPQTILTTIGNDVDASRGTTFQGLVILNTNGVGACVHIRNGGLVFNDCTIQCTGVNGEGVLITQMYAQTWTQNFISGKSSAMRLFSDTTAGQKSINNNQFIGCRFFGLTTGANGIYINSTPTVREIRYNSFIGCDIEQTSRGLYNNATDNVFISLNNEATSVSMEETATASATHIMPKATLGTTFTSSQLSEIIPPNHLYGDTYPRQFAGTTATVYRGITFPGTTSYMGANTLNDYEEGEWTATFVCGTSGTITLDSGINKGTYIQIGRTVTITGYFKVTSVSSPTGSLKINGLPFSGGALYYKFRNSVTIAGEGLETTATTALQGTIQGEAKISTTKFAAGVASDLASGIKANSEIWINATYVIDTI